MPGGSKGKPLGSVFSDGFVGIHTKVLLVVAGHLAQYEYKPSCFIALSNQPVLTYATRAILSIIN
ncbi:hypothetical protein [Nostoc sp.]|uniref:hypothetical protein n=1 Tax=Nostoc sp. TaxID=1180 RepID=UPI002FF7F6B4